MDKMRVYESIDGKVKIAVDALGVCVRKEGHIIMDADVDCAANADFIGAALADYFNAKYIHTINDDGKPLQDNPAAKKLYESLKDHKRVCQDNTNAFCAIVLITCSLLVLILDAIH